MTQDHKEMPRECKVIWDDEYCSAYEMDEITGDATLYILRSEYDNLQAENERLRKALSKIERCPYSPLFAVVVAREALEGK